MNNNFLSEVQEYIATKLNEQLSSYCAFFPENSRSIDYEIKKALGKQGIVGIVLTPHADYIGNYEDKGIAWELPDIEVDVVENVTVNRGLSNDTGEDIALSAFDVLCPPGAQGTGKFSPRSFDQGEDNSLIVNKVTFSCAVWNDGAAPFGYVFWNVVDGTTTSKPGDFREGQEITFTSTVEGYVVQKVEVNGIPQEVVPGLSAYTYTVGAGTQFVDVSFGMPQVLPYKNEVEYLQSSVGQYINLGIAGRDITRVDFKFQPNAVVSTSYEVFGDIDHTNGYSFSKRSSANKVAVNGSSSDSYLSPQFVIDEVKDYAVSIQGTDVVINGNSYVAGRAADQFGLEIALFGYRASIRSAFGNSAIKLYYFTIWQNGVKAREMIPVVDWQDVPCMYDRVTGVLFYNAGTGEFVPGPVSNSAT